MDIIIYVFAVGLCFTQGYNAYTCEKQTKIFNKRDLPLKDVKEYNHFCGKLIYGFGFAAMITFGMMVISSSAIIAILGPILLIAEAVALIKIYSKNEIKYIRQY